MSSSKERVRGLNETGASYSVQPVRLLLNDISTIKRQSVDENIETDNNIQQQTEESSLGTEDTSGKELEHEVLAQPAAIKYEMDFDKEDFYQTIDVKQECYTEGHLSQLHKLRNSQLTSGQKRTACPNLVALEDGACSPKLPRPGIETEDAELINLSSFLNSPLVPATKSDLRLLDKLQTPDPTPSSSSSVVANLLLPSEVPSSVTLTFEASDEEDDSPKSHDSMAFLPQKIKDLTWGAVSDCNKDINNAAKLMPVPHLASEITVNSASSSSMVPAENQELMSLHSELCLPVDNEELKHEVLYISSPELVCYTSILKNNNIVMFPVFIEGPQDAMFLEEVHMTIRKFNELLDNLFIYQCYQVAGTEGRQKLEAVLKFLVRGESIANLAQEYKITKITFSKYLPEILNAIFKILGLLTEKEDTWTQIQKSFTERLGLPHCCGVLNAKTIMTWRPAAPACLPLITLTDADYNFLHLDMEANIEDQAIDFKATRMHKTIHYKSMLLPKLGFFVGNKHLRPTSAIWSLYSNASADTPIPYLYNSRVEKALRVSDNAHGILSTKFKIYDKIMILSPNLAKTVVKATCALHNWLKQGSPGYMTPGLVDVETKGEITLGSWRFAPRQIFQPVRLFQERCRRTRTNKYERRRDTYALNLHHAEQTNSQNNSF